MKYLTAGESHGKGLVAIVEGFPSGVKIDCDFVASELSRRQGGFGRGGRMKIEKDSAVFYSGLRGGLTLGTPISFVIENKDYENWISEMHAFLPPENKKQLLCVRPGHADYVGCVKYGFDDARNVLERASARNTATVVAIGALCKCLLKNVGIEVFSAVETIGGESVGEKLVPSEEMKEKIKNSKVYTFDGDAENRMVRAIENAAKNGDTLGGKVKIIVSGMPLGVGSFTSAERRLENVLTGAVMGIQAVKAVEIGAGAQFALEQGSNLMDEMYAGGEGIERLTNCAGGIEGGMSNGENIEISAVIKPIPTVMKGLRTINIKTGEAARSAPERSDVCAVPAAAVVCEAAVAYAVSDVLLGCFGGDTLQELKDRIQTRRQAGAIWKK